MEQVGMVDLAVDDLRPFRVGLAVGDSAMDSKTTKSKTYSRTSPIAVHRGVAYGKTNAKGTEVVHGQVDHANLFHTYLQAVGVDSTDSFDVEGRDVPIADPASKMIRQILA